MAKNTNAAGGDWFNAGKKPGAFKDAFGPRENASTVEKAEAAPVVESPVVEKPVVEATSDRAPVTVPSAVENKTTETVPTEQKPAEVVAPVEATTPTTKTEAAVTPQPKRIIKAEKSALIEIPGMKPKSAEELAFELRQGQNLQRKLNEMDVREQRLREREEALMSGTVERSNANAQGRTAPEVKAPVAEEGPRPVRPKDSIPGDPEYDQWLVDEIAWNSRQTARQVISSISARDVAAQAEQAKANETLTANIGAWNRSLEQHLPFDFASLDQAAQTETFNRINSVAQRVLNVDLRDQARMSQTRMAPEQFALLIAAAYPEGSMPPGYVADNGEAEDEGVIDQVRQAAGPVVQGDKPQPLHDTVTNTVAPARKDERPRGSRWQEAWRPQTA